MVNKSNILVASDTVTGGVALAPLGTTEPADVATALPEAFQRAGYVSSDGVERNESVDTDTIKAWGGNTVRIVKKSTEVTINFAFLEYLNPVVQKAIYGDGHVKSTKATTEHGNQIELDGVIEMGPHRILVIEMVDGDIRGRLVFHDVQISSREKYTAKDAETMVRKVTFTAFPDENGSYFHEYWDDGKKTAA